LNKKANGNKKIKQSGKRDQDLLKVLQERLAEAQKFETIGLLASGLAHNVNSPLAAIILTAEVALAKHPELVELKDILHSAERIQEIIGNLAEKCQQEQTDEAGDVDLNQLVQDELRFLQANLFLKHRVEVKTSLKAHLPPIRGHFGDFSLCFFHLVQNALDAMIQAPLCRLTVRTGFLKSRKSVWLSVADTGCGIPKANLPRIFEPLFTTKADLNLNLEQYRLAPAGLGLWVVRQVLDKYRAGIQVQSRVGQGSVFKIAVPMG